MATSLEVFERILKQHHQSVTKARKAVFEALLGTEPLSMHALVEKARGVDRASVYRAVDLFERIGIAQRLTTGWKYKLELTDAFTEHHHHLTCNTCGKTVALSEDELEQFIEQIARKYGFVPSGHQIEIQGQCAACRAM